MITPVACSLRVAASPLKGATPAARQAGSAVFPGGVALRVSQCVDEPLK